MAASIPALAQWTASLKEFHVPRWAQLPEIDLYADQVVIYLERALKPLFAGGGTFITASMIHNYVKLDLMPKPIKKRYSKKHVAYLLTITILKQVLAIADISDGILSQADKVNNGYDLFCEELEGAIQTMLGEMARGPWAQRPLAQDGVAVRMAAYAVISKMIALHTIQLANAVDIQQVAPQMAKGQLTLE